MTKTLPRLSRARAAQNLRSGREIEHLVVMALLLCAALGMAQTAPTAPDRPWHAPDEQRMEHYAAAQPPIPFAVDAKTTYSLADLIDLAEAHNPETKLAWARARDRADALGIARSELYPTLAVVAMTGADREEVYLNTRFYRITVGSFDLPFDLQYTIFDFGARTGRIDAAKANLLAADFAFNDVHRRLIFQVAAAYYQLLNANGQEAAARAALANAQAVQQAAEASLENGLATLPDVLEARAATAQAEYDLQAALGGEEVAHGNLLTALGASPLSALSVQPIDALNIPDSVEVSVDQAIDRAIAERPDLMQRVAAIRAATAQIKEARAAYFPTLKLFAAPDPQALYGLQQTLPWGSTADLDGAMSLRLSWTIFDGGARKNRVAQTRDELRAAEADAAETRDEVENSVWTAYSNLKTAFRQRQAAASLLAASDQSYNAALESYHAGVRNLLDVTQAQQLLAHARSTDVLARAQVLTALADLAFETAQSIQPTPARPQP
jgi:outer membrane protein